jgi:type I restriction enzyme S subunit
MEVKPGYKQTEVGVIPDDWEVKTLGELSNIYRGASPRPIDDPKWFDEKSQIGWVRISDVTKSKRRLKETTQRLSELGVRHSRFVPASSLIMSICATVGRPIITDIDVCIHDGFVVFEKSQVFTSVPTLKL